MTILDRLADHARKRVSQAKKVLSADEIKRMLKNEIRQM